MECIHNIRMLPTQVCMDTRAHSRARGRACVPRAAYVVHAACRPQAAGLRRIRHAHTSVLLGKSSVGFLLFLVTGTAVACRPVSFDSTLYSPRGIPHTPHAKRHTPRTLRRTPCEEHIRILRNTS